MTWPDADFVQNFVSKLFKLSIEIKKTTPKDDRSYRTDKL